MALNAQTKLCALLGDPVEHSLSPLIHNAAFEELGLDFAYLAFCVQQSQLQSAVEGIRALNIRGSSVTIPHKVEAMQFVDQIEPIAKKIGSINTIVNDKGTLRGYNSDGSGALKAFQNSAARLEGKSVLVIGSGGAARAIAFTLAAKASLKEISIVGVLQGETAALVNNLKDYAEIPVRGELLKEGFFEEYSSKTDVLINCTPVGMYPDMDSSPVPSGFLQKDMVVFDVVYNPPKTRLLMEAEKAGCTTISGLDMFINQAVDQFELWTGEKAPEALMRKVLLENLGASRA